MAVTPLESEALATAAAQLQDIQACERTPVELSRFVECLDTEEGEPFFFHMHEPESGWYWQRALLEEWLDSRRYLVYKARQLGITWMVGLLTLWQMLYRSGTRCLIVSINETEAKKVIGRIWIMYKSLPPHLREHVKLVRPSRGGDPSDTIEVRHEDGRLSTILALPSTSKAGHGETAAVVILDELARQDYALKTWTAVLPTAAKGGLILGVSTGNGVSTDAGAGNFFHYLWSNRDELGLRGRFLSVFTHPERDEAWYEREAIGLPAAQRGEQWPRTEREGFILTGDPYFDVDTLAWYDENAIADPIGRGWFVHQQGDFSATFEEGEFGPVSIFALPEEEHEYVLAADVATGRGNDYSAAYVLDTATFELVCEFHAKLPEDVYAEQLYIIGKLYNHATLAVEDAGGFGDAVVISLRDQKEHRPPYGRLYQQRTLTQPDLPEHKRWGYPVNTHTRPQMLKELQRALRERVFPYISPDLLSELQTFVYRDTNPSPRAQQGCNDDRVMALAGACEINRVRSMPSRTREREDLPSRPWERKRRRLRVA